MLFDVVRGDIALLAEGVVILLEALSFLFLIAIAYILLVTEPLRPADIKQSKSQTPLWIAVFIAVVFITFIGAHILVHKLHVMEAALSIALGGALAVTCYFALIRGAIKSGNRSVPYTMMVWATSTVLSVLTLIFIYLGRTHFKFESQGTISASEAASVAGVVLSAVGVVFTYIMQSECVFR